MEKKKKPFYKKWWVWVIAVIVVVGVVGGDSSDEPKLVETSGTAANGGEEDTAGEISTESTTFNIGDTIELKNFRVTVNSVRTSQGQDFFTPEEGKEFFIVDVTVENISDSDQIISSIMMFDIVDPDGRKLQQSVSAFGLLNGQLDGTVGAGRKITGEYAVEVPQGQTGLELEFNASLITGKQIIVTLN